MGKKEVKTNAMRILDRNKIPYEIINYECDEFIDGLHTAEKTGAPVEQSFKTLVMSGKAAAGGNRQYYVFVVPIAEEVDLKAAAKCVGEKSLEMLHVKDLTPLTGYVRGGCSPLGMKKQFPTVVHESAASFDKIYISGGRIGTSITVGTVILTKLVRQPLPSCYIIFSFTCLRHLIPDLACHLCAFTSGKIHDLLKFSTLYRCHTVIYMFSVL